MTPLADPLYADTSALVKLVLDEPESESLASHVVSSGLQLASSEIAEVELLRAVSRVDRERLEDASELLKRTILLPLTSSIRRRAANVRPETIRSLDAIHLSTAIELQVDLHSLVSYDNRMVEAARTLGMATSSPGAE